MIYIKYLRYVPSKDVRVVSPGEGFLQLLQLERGEGGSVAALLPLGRGTEVVHLALAGLLVSA